MEIVFLQWLHLLAAAVWLGGLLFISMVLLPVVRHRFPPEISSEVISALARRFQPIGWIALILLLLTGFRRAVLVFEGFPELFQAFSTTPYGKLLRAKLLLVCVIIAMQLLHDFVLGPQVRKLATEQSPGLARARAATIGLSVGTILLTLVVLGLAATLRFR
jgi:uncharacterized membrane protein